MYVLDGVGFICHPNTGSRSLKRFLLANSAKVVKPQHFMCLDTIKECRAVISVVRNPYDTMASWYWRIKPVSFEQWLRQTLEGPKDYEGPHEGMFYGLPYTTHMIRFERLVPMMSQAFEQLELPELKLTHEGMSRHRAHQHYRVLYNEECIKMVQNYYGPILSQLGYKY